MEISAVSRGPARPAFRDFVRDRRVMQFLATRAPVGMSPEVHRYGPASQEISICWMTRGALLDDSSSSSAVRAVLEVVIVKVGDLLSEKKASARALETWLPASLSFLALAFPLLRSLGLHESLRRAKKELVPEFRVRRAILASSCATICFSCAFSCSNLCILLSVLFSTELV